MNFNYKPYISFKELEVKWIFHFEGGENGEIDVVVDVVSTLYGAHDAAVAILKSKVPGLEITPFNTKLNGKNIALSFTKQYEIGGMIIR